jgi:sporulation protein YlmC with PRC-barrel domain
MTRVLESSIVDQAGKKIASIDGLAIDATLGQVAYAIVKFDQPRGGENQIHAVPWRALLPDRGGQILLLQTDERYYDERNSFNPSEPPKFEDKEWGATVHRRFDVEPYWEVHQYFDSTHATLGSGGWGFRGKYDQLYDEGKSKEISGKVTRIFNVRPLAGMSPGLALAIETGDGEEIVHLGPTWFINRQDLAVKEGDEVTVTGAEATIASESVFIASSVKAGRETIHLRDPKTGQSAWTEWRAENNPELDPAQVEKRHASWETDRPTIVTVLDDELLGLQAETTGGEALGEVQDVVFERNAGAIAYIIIDSGRENLKPVPWFASRIDKIGKKLVLAVSEDAFAKGPSFTENNWPNLTDPQYVRRVHEPFELRRSFQMYRPASAQVQGEEAGEAQLEYVRKGTEDKTYTGRVVAITREAPQEGMEDAIFLYVQGEVGRQRVYVGPAWWVARQDFEIRRGDNVTVSGTMFKEGNFTNVIAETIEVGGERINLASDSGQPRWAGEARTAEDDEEDDSDADRDRENDDDNARDRNRNTGGGGGGGDDDDGRDDDDGV